MAYVCLNFVPRRVTFVVCCMLNYLLGQACLTTYFSRLRQLLPSSDCTAGHNILVAVCVCVCAWGV